MLCFRYGGFRLFSRSICRVLQGLESTKSFNYLNSEDRGMEYYYVPGLERVTGVGGGPLDRAGLLPFIVSERESPAIDSIQNRTEDSRGGPSEARRKLCTSSKSHTKLLSMSIPKSPSEGKIYTPDRFCSPCDWGGNFS